MSEQNKKQIVFYDVDTQNDFMNADGALAVPNAEEIKPNLEKLTQYALNNQIKIIASVDRHFGTAKYKAREGELAKYGGPFPDHCMDGTKGQKKIQETELPIPIRIENRKYNNGSVENIAKTRNQLIIEKQSYDVFTNKNIEKILNPNMKLIMYGVATDYCVKAVALGARAKGLEVNLVLDAIEAVNLKPDDGANALKEMYKAGVKPITTAEVLKGNF